MPQRFALLVVLLLWSITPTLGAQSAPAPSGGEGEPSASAPSTAPAEPTATVQIDPDANPDDGIEFVLPEQEPENPEADKTISNKLNDIVPDTGNESVDGAVATFNDAIGGLVQGFFAILPQLVIATLVLVVTGFLVRLIDKFSSHIFKKARIKTSLRDLFRIFVRTGVWFVALMVAAGIIFPGFGFSNLVATAGLASIAVGFAFQDIFANFFAGILILWRFPFENGDFIEVDGVSGRVEDVEIRMTLIRQTDGDLVLVPNSTIFQNNVTIYTNRPTRRVELAVGIAYGESVAEGKKVILDAVKSCETVRATPSPEVLATAFGASSIDFDVLWYTDNKPIDERRSRSEVLQAIKEALDEAGIEIPYPYRTLTFSKNEPDIIQAVAGRLGRSATVEDRGDASGGADEAPGGGEG